MTLWLFEPPTVELTHSIDNGHIDYERFGIRFKTLQGVTVYRIGGVWKALQSPPPEAWQAADIVFWGGHEYAVDDEIHNELVAAGLWNGGSTPVTQDIFVDEFLDTFGSIDSGPSTDTFTDIFNANF